MVDPIRPTDREAIQLAQHLLSGARWASLGVLDAQGHPFVTRIGFARAPDGAPISLVSDLSAHTKAIREDPRCSLLIGDVGAKGDPLTHPRLTLKATAEFIRKNAAGYEDLAAHYLKHHPKAKLYIGFGDFSFLRFNLLEAALNGGFGKAYRLGKSDLAGIG